MMLIISMMTLISSNGNGCSRHQYVRHLLFSICKETTNSIFNNVIVTVSLLQLVLIHYFHGTAFTLSRATRITFEFTPTSAQSATKLSLLSGRDVLSSKLFAPMAENSLISWQQQRLVRLASNIKYCRRLWFFIKGPGG